MNTQEILAKYLALHDALGRQQDAADKEAFDNQHREIWDNCDLELSERQAELEAKTALTDEESRELVEVIERLG